MPDQNLMSRVRSWFSRTSSDGSDLGLDSQLTHEPRPSLLHPFAKRDAAIQSLQTGFVTLTDLMVGIRENLERQGQRNDELMQHLARLPAALEQLPESNRMQGETLRALHQELSQQNGQQQRLAEILDHVSKSSSSQSEVLEGLQERVDRMRQTDEQIASNLNDVGATMQELGRSTSTGAQILESLRDNMSSRDSELQQVLLRQGTRFTVMLSIAIFLSISALVAVAVIGYLLLMKQP
ncbi:MAG TPA: hypothetical protein VGB55_10670 [Tepidisphaeraceae bacterium]|jgi:chromosome segregation ATPase